MSDSAACWEFKLPWRDERRANTVDQLVPFRAYVLDGPESGVARRSVNRGFDRKHNLAEDVQNCRRIRQRWHILETSSDVYGSALRT